MGPADRAEVRLLLRAVQLQVEALRRRLPTDRELLVAQDALAECHRRLNRPVPVPTRVEAPPMPASLVEHRKAKGIH